MTAHDFCRCKVPDVARAEGVDICEKCGDRVRDPHEEARDRAIAATARAVASIERQLANGNGSSSNGSTFPADLAAPVPRVALTRTESAESLGCGLTHFKTEIAPHLPVVRHNSKPVYLVSDLEKWAEEHAEPPINEQLGESKP